MNVSGKMLLTALAIALGATAVYLFVTNVNTTAFIFRESSVSKVYFADHISPAHSAVIELFNRTHAGKIEVIPVDLNFSKFSTNERKELLARSLRSKSDRLDIFSVDYIWTPRFAKWCVDLNPYVPAPAQRNIIPPAIRSCIYNDRLVAMPLYIDIGVMYYRTDIINRLPNAAEIDRKLQSSIGWDELIALQKKLKYDNRPFYIFQANDYEGLICNYFEIISSLEPEFFANNQIDLRSDVAKRSLQYLVDLVHAQKASPLKVTEFDENKSYEYMLDSNAVFVRGWPNFVENFRKIYSDTSKFSSIGRAAIPHFQGNRPTSVYGGWNLMVSKFSTKKEAAIEFIRFLQTEESQKMMFELGGYIPVNEGIYRDSAYMRLHPDLGYYKGLVDRGFHRPFIEDYTRISDIISYFIHRAIKKEITVDEALERASVMIDSKALLIR